jgi:hypothetical protein
MLSDEAGQSVGQRACGEGSNDADGTAGILSGNVLRVRWIAGGRCDEK